MALEQPKEEKKQPENLTARLPNYAKLYATNVAVIEGTEDFRVEVYNERFESDHGRHYVSDGMVIFSPQAAKILFVRLGEILASYESKHGKIEITKKSIQELLKLDDEDV